MYFFIIRPIQITLLHYYLLLLNNNVSNIAQFSIDLKIQIKWGLIKQTDGSVSGSHCFTVIIYKHYLHYKHPPFGSFLLTHIFITLFLCVSTFSLSLCLFFFFFFFHPCGNAHTRCVQFGISVPSFPNVSARQFPNRNRMKNNEYETVEHVNSDLTLMLENAKRYNVPYSGIYKRALRLQHIQQVGSRRRKSLPVEEVGGAKAAALLLTVQVKRKELLQRDDDDGDSMMSSSTSDTNSVKRKRLVHSCNCCPWLWPLKLLHIYTKDDLGPQHDRKIFVKKKKDRISWIRST